MKVLRIKECSYTIVNLKKKVWIEQPMNYNKINN